MAWHVRSKTMHSRRSFTPITRRRSRNVWTGGEKKHIHPEEEAKVINNGSCVTRTFTFEQHPALVRRISIKKTKREHKCIYFCWERRDLNNLRIVYMILSAIHEPILNASTHIHFHYWPYQKLKVARRDQKVNDSDTHASSTAAAPNTREDPFQMNLLSKRW